MNELFFYVELTFNYIKTPKLKKLNSVYKEAKFRIKETPKLHNSLHNKKQILPRYKAQ